MSPRIERYFQYLLSFTGSLLLLLLSTLIFIDASEAAEKGKSRFERACEPADEKIIVSLSGDVLPHSPLQQQAQDSETRFRSLWTELEPFFKQSHLTFANLEGAVAKDLTGKGTIVPTDKLFDDVAYTGTKLKFNYHPLILTDMQESGFDILSAANNHTMDRGPLGVDMTIESYRESDMPFIGIMHSKDKHEWDRSMFSGKSKIIKTTEDSISTVTTTGSIRIGWIGCSEQMNLADSQNQVWHCIDDFKLIKTEVQRLLSSKEADVVFLSMHWGEEYHLKQRVGQTDLAHRYLNAGVSAIVGHHPHVLQPIERFKTKDGRETFVAYSLGNFVSNQETVEQRTAATVFLGLSKDARTGKVWLNGYTFIPTWMRRSPFTVMPLDAALKTVKAELKRPLAQGRIENPEDELDLMEKAPDLIREVLGTERMMTHNQKVSSTPECH